MSAFLQDLRFGFRMLAKNPGFTAVAVLTLALGIGANTAIFSVVDAVLLKPLPYPDPDRLAALWETDPGSMGGRWGQFPASGPDFLDWQAQSHLFEGMSAITVTDGTLTGFAEPLHVMGLSVSPNVFQLLGVQPALGRSFLPDEAATGHEHVILLSYGLWQSAFGGQKDVVGSKVTLDGESRYVVGVMPEDLKFPVVWGRVPQYWVPIPKDALAKSGRGGHWLWVLARVKKGFSLRQATAELATISARLTKQYPDTNTRVGAEVKSLHEQLTFRVSAVLWVLFAAVGFLLLIAGVNVANLLLTRALGRQREMAIRLAVGSGIGRLARQLLTESVLLFVLGGAAGLVVGQGMLHLLLHQAPAGYIPGTMSVQLDSRVFIFAFIITFITGMLAGLIPAFAATRVSSSDLIKESGPAVAASHGFTRGVLTAGEIALALIVLVGAGLATRSMALLLEVPLGFEPRHLVAGTVALPDSRYAKDPQAFFRKLIDRVQALPGVVSAGATSELPFGGHSNGPVIIEGQPEPENPWASSLAEYCVVTPGYFRAMRIPLLDGRDVADTDTSKTPTVAVINETMAHHFWPQQSAIGKRFKFLGDAPWVMVIGVVADVREFGLARPPIPEIYYAESQAASTSLTLVVRSAVDPRAQIPSVRQALYSLDRDLPWIGVQTLAEIVSESSHEKRFLALLLSIFGATALSLAAVGVYGVVSYAVSQRTREIGIRIAFGATVRNVVGLLLQQILLAVSAGVGAGLMGAWMLSRYLTSILYGVRPTDLLTYAAATLLMAAVALLACLVPAHRATKIDPMVALRYE